MKSLLALILSLAFLALQPVHARALGMNDVSQLLPLPGVQELQQMLAPPERGARGALLPYEAYRLLPLLSDQADQDQVYLHNLRVIGVRFDPCFAEGRSPTKCRPQIRLVWQPLLAVGDQVTTLDAAIHTFHEFTEAEWKRIELELKLLPQSRNRVSFLTVQPEIQTQGYAGDYWKRLRQLILSECGESNLIRATVMTVRMSRRWTFAGIDRNGSGWTVMRIPTLEQANPVSQTFLLSPEGMMNLEEFVGGVSALPKSEELWMRLLVNSLELKKAESEANLMSVVRRAIRLENPGFHNPGTADCVSCHLAQPVRLWGEKNFPNWNWRGEFGTDRFTGSRQDLRNSSVNPFRTDRMRAFGYFGRDPILSQRVIHETALVVDRLNRK